MNAAPRVVGFLFGLSAMLAVAAIAAEDISVPLQARAHAREAVESSDPAARVAAFAAAARLMPEHPRYLLGLASARTAAGELDLAVQALDQLATLGSHVDLASREALAPLRDRDDFQAAAARMARLLEPVGRGQVAFSLPEMRGLVEGIAYREKTGDAFFGDVRERAIWRRTANGTVSRFDTTDELPFGVFGLEIDEIHGALWAASSAVPQMRGYTEDMKGRAGIVELDLETGLVRRTIILPRDQREHVIGDLLVGSDGTVYATDSAAPILWRLAPGAEALEAWVESPEFLSLQGLALAEDERSLLVAAYGNGLLRIDLADRAVTRLRAPAGATHLGIDGMERTRDGALIAVQNGISPPRIVRVEIDSESGAVRSVTVLEAAHSTLVDPTLLCATPDGMLVIGDAGWRFFEEDRATDDPPQRAVPVLLIPSASHL